MVDEQLILAAERLRDRLEDLRRELRRRYSTAARQVTAEDLKRGATRAAETWLVEIAADASVVAVVGEAVAGDLSVHFQRLLTFSEHATTRGRYESEIKAVLRSYTVDVILPLKRGRGLMPRSSTPSDTGESALTVFIGQSFSDSDKAVNKAVADILEAIGITVATGEKPKADTISEKVKNLIETQSVFIGVFTRRDKIARKPEWTTSPWVIDEKAYALGRQKRLILLKEEGVGSIGGIQGDYEYIEFSRGKLELMLVRLVQAFDVVTRGLRK